MSVERVTHGGRDGDGAVLHGVDEAAAEADVALIENGALAGRGRPLRLVEAKREVLFGDVLESAGIVGLAIAGLHRKLGVKLGRMSGDPAWMDGLELVREKPRVIVSLADPERIGGKILLRDEPRLARGVVAAAHTDALALAERIEGKAHVLAHDRAVGNADRTGLGRQIAVEELAERTLADEADARGVLLLRIGKLEVVGDAADLGLADFAHGEDHAGDLLLGEAVQEVALVLAGIDAAQQLDAVVRVTDAGVVPRGDEVGPHGHGMVEEGAELDLCVAENVGIGRAACAVFA